MTGVSTLGQALNQISRIKEQQTLFNNLNLQFTTGKKTQQFSGLGIDSLTSQRARADVRSLNTYTDNITRAETRINLMLNAVEEFQAQSESFWEFLIGFSQETVHQEGEEILGDDPSTVAVETDVPIGMTSAELDGDFRAMQEFAGSLFDFLGELLNAKEGDRYLLGGSQTTTQPYTDTGTLDSAITSLISGWRGGTASNSDLFADLQTRTATTANPNVITDTIVGYSAALSNGDVGNIFVRVSDSSEIEYTALANDQAFRDIMVALSFIKNPDLGPIADAYIPPNAPPAAPDVEGAPGNTLAEMKENFFAVFNDVRTMVSKAIDEIDQVRFKLENTKARILELKQNYAEEKNTLLNTVSGAEDADINLVAVQINLLQIQLDASYRITAKLQELSLTNYLA
jgi:flagellar hook-associated protein 3 FlgL